jgi:hypothetical protein
MTPKTQSVCKWKPDGLCVLNGSIVGTVKKGLHDNWFAHGCQNDWEDVLIGDFPTRDAAKSALEYWVEGQL